MKMNKEELFSLTANSLYLHIPFCDELCSYCDFCKYIHLENKHEEYIKKVKDDLLKVSNKELKTFYIGGGTPSCLSINLLEDLLSFIYKNFKIEDEFTIEANPESVSSEKIKLLKKYGVNRVSLGVQTFKEESLKLLNRKHNYNLVKKVVNDLQKNGINNINLDFIYGIKGESIKDIENNIDLGLNLHITHLSYYALQIEQGTKFYYLKNMNVDDDKLAEQYAFIVQKLKKNNFDRYEVSNFALKGYESKHNLNYWYNKNFYGIGCSASGYIFPYRFKNTSRLNDYLNENNSLEIEKEDKDDEEFNFLMLNLRLVKGFDVTEFKSLFKKDFFTEYKKEYEKNKSFFDYDFPYLKVKDEYLYVLDEILVDLLHFKSC